MKRRKPKKPSQTRRHRESVAAKRRARAFYRLRNNDDVLEQEEAEGLRSWRGCGIVVAVLVGFVLAGWALKLFL